MSQWTKYWEFWVVGLLILLSVATEHPWSSIRLTFRSEPVDPLKAQVIRLWDQSVEECRMFHPGDLDCVKRQFEANYQFYMSREQRLIVGPPGVPGPNLTRKDR